MYSQDKKNNRAMIVGIALVVLVILVTILRPSFSQKKNDAAPAPSQQQNALVAKPITSQELMNKITHKENLTIIDVRDSASFLLSHILNSRNMTLDDINKGMPSWDKSKTYILLDDAQSPALVSLARDIFQQSGFANTYYLSGGFADWKNQDYPLIADGDPYSLTDQAKVNYINADGLKKSLDGNENLYIIDLRKPSAFVDGHIKDSVNIYLDDLEKRYAEIPLGKKIILVDNDGLWAFKGAVRLFDMGVFNVFALSDGLDAWKKKGYEIVK